MKGFNMRTICCLESITTLILDMLSESLRMRLEIAMTEYSNTLLSSRLSPSRPDLMYSYSFRKAVK